MKRILIKKSTDKQFYFTVVSTNNKVIATSETYTDKASCRRGIAALCNFFYEIVFSHYTIIDTTKKQKQ